MASPIETLPDMGPRLVPRGRLLLVEDDPLLLPVYGRILRRAGYEVVHAYEALVRSDTPGLAQPADLFAAAEQLGRVRELGRAIRALAARMAQQVARLFVNLHPLDLEDADLFRPDAPLSRFGPRVVLEITERAPLDGLVGLAERNAELRALGFRLALDDLGAGYSGLATFVNLKPDVVKLDMALTRHIDSEPRQRMLVETLVALCRELGIDVIAEGVETEAERDVLVTAGCDLLQGFLFGRPQRTLID